MLYEEDSNCNHSPYSVQSLARMESASALEGEIYEQLGYTIIYIVNLHSNSCVKGTLLEVNEQLVSNISLIVSKVTIVPGIAWLYMYA